MNAKSFYCSADFVKSSISAHYRHQPVQQHALILQESHGCDISLMLLFAGWRLGIYQKQPDSHQAQDKDRTSAPLPHQSRKITGPAPINPKKTKKTFGQSPKNTMPYSLYKALMGLSRTHQKIIKKHRILRKAQKGTPAYPLYLARELEAEFKAIEAYVACLNGAGLTLSRQGFTKPDPHIPNPTHMAFAKPDPRTPNPTHMAFTKPDLAPAYPAHSPASPLLPEKDLDPLYHYLLHKNVENIERSLELLCCSPEFSRFA